MTLGILNVLVPLCDNISDIDEIGQILLPLQKHLAYNYRIFISPCHHTLCGRWVLMSDVYLVLDEYCYEKWKFSKKHLMKIETSVFMTSLISDRRDDVLSISWESPRSAKYTSIYEFV